MILFLPQFIIFQAGEWLKDVVSILSDLSEANSVLSAVIVEHKGLYVTGVC